MIGFPMILINTASIIFIAVIIIFAWRKRNNIGVAQFIIAAFFMIVWAAASFIEMAVSDIGQKILWRNITQIGVFYVPPASMFFAIAYSGILKKTRKWLMYPVYGVQTISILLIFTDGWHHLMRKNIELVQTSLNTVITVESTLLAKLLISLNFVYMTAALLLLIVYAARTTNNMRKQVLITLGGMGIAVAYSLIKVVSSEQIGTFLPISGVFALVCAVLLFGILRYNFLTVLPVARSEVFNIIDEGILVCTPKGEVLDANAAAIRIFSGSASGPIERDASGFLAIDQLLQHQYPVWFSALSHCRAEQLDISQTVGEETHYYRCTVYELDNRKRHAIGTISVIRDITVQKIKNELLQQRAERDSLIDIYNRHTFIERIENTLSHYDSQVSLIFFDLDDFKGINDQYGHMAGDYVLKELCDCIKQTIGGSSIIGRMGGEEFGIFFKDTDPDRSLNIAKQLRKNVENRNFQFDGHPIRVTISAGIATGSGVSFVQLYQKADRMLYQAKEAGKNCVRSIII